MNLESDNLIDPNKIQISEKFYKLLHFIQNIANRNVHRIDFLKQISEKLFSTLNCNSIEIWVRENHNYTHCEISVNTNNSFHYEVVSFDVNDKDEIIKFNNENTILDYLKVIIINRSYDSSQSFFTEYGSFWIDDTRKSVRSIIPSAITPNYNSYNISNKKNALAIIPLIVGNKNIGLFQLTSEVLNYFSASTMGVYESIAQLLGSSIITHQTQAALRERLKELACLYDIVQVAGRSGITKDDILQSIVELLPPAWQYPEITVGRIEFDGQIYSTSKFHKGWQKQTAEIIVKNIKRGIIEVVYTEVKSQLDEGPFLREERHLINAIARQATLILEKKESEEEKFVVQEQLRHADRLATIGQLAAGVAHELNEPLAGILGFSQLISKYEDLPEGAKKDTDKIVKSTLHARDVIKKLLLFAREIKPEIQKVNINKTIEEDLFFFEARCAKAGIELILILSPEMPEFLGERSQLNQVLINLVVNSMQAMPEGGKLIIETHAIDDHILLVVEDTGIGMSEDVKKKCFLPFYTTKDVNEGTGLGLAVVHGIITLHNGSIKVKSKVGSGTRFEVRLPRNVSKN